MNINNIQKDKLLHFSISAVIAVILKLLLLLLFSNIISIVISFIITMLIGIAKEIYDKVSKKGTLEFNDFIADCIGALIGCL